LLARRVLRNPVKGRCMFVAERVADFLDLVSLEIQGPANDEEAALCCEPLRLFADGFGRGFAIDHAINCRKVVCTRPAHFYSPIGTVDETETSMI
jgi:hypothetical protein